MKEDDPENTKAVKKVKFSERIMTGLKNLKPLVRRPLLNYLALIGAMQCVVLGVYVF